ncbi:putative MFS transporter [Penicillium brasilianum]|uniref:Putative MFS transporter n=1 Tax=Penicillium brasilianum TaxID=104259 RepID=A0A1S9RSP8_PENBI|nr:putative MFS transporter [Penicillium brasilianum]
MGSWNKILGFLHGGNESKRPRFLEIRSARWFILFTVSFAACTDIFMYGLIVPVTPTALERRVGLAEDKVQTWTSVLLALYSAALLAFSPIIGYLADRAGSRRWPFLVGLVLLAAATALLCIGANIGLWIAGRLFQGAAAAVVWTVGIALLVDTVGKEGLGQAIGYVSMSLSIGTLAGPLLGGVLYQHGGYYSVFGLAFGLIGIDILLRLILIEKKHAARWLTPERRPLSPEQNVGEKTPPDTAPESSVMGNSTPSDPSEKQSTKARNPLVQAITLLSSSRLIVSLWGYFIVSLVLTSFDSVLPLFVQETFGWEQTGQGLIFIPMMVPHLTDPITGYIIDKYPGSPRYLASGAFVCAVPVAVLLRLVTDDTMHHKVILCVLLALLGLCLAVAMPPLVTEVFHAVKEKEDEFPDSFGRGGAMALAFGLSNMGFAAGSLVGPFFAGFIRQDAGWGTMGWAMGLIAGVSAIPVLLFIGGWIGKKPSAPTEADKSTLE